MRPATPSEMLGDTIATLTERCDPGSQPEKVHPRELALFGRTQTP